MACVSSASVKEEEEPRIILVDERVYRLEVVSPLVFDIKTTLREMINNHPAQFAAPWKSAVEIENLYRRKAGGTFAEASENIFSSPIEAIFNFPDVFECINRKGTIKSFEDIKFRPCSITAEGNTEWMPKVVQTNEFLEEEGRFARRGAEIKEKPRQPTVKEYLHHLKLFTELRNSETVFSEEQHRQLLAFFVINLIDHFGMDDTMKVSIMRRYYTAVTNRNIFGDDLSDEQVAEKLFESGVPQLVVVFDEPDNEITLIRKHFVDGPPRADLPMQPDVEKFFTSQNLQQPVVDKRYAAEEYEPLDPDAETFSSPVLVRGEPRIDKRCASTQLGGVLYHNRPESKKYPHPSNACEDQLAFLRYHFKYDDFES